MAKTWTYKLWKSLTKRLVTNLATRDEVIRKVSYELEAPPEPVADDAHREAMPGTIAVFSGFYRSGSSVLSALFCEFDNVSVLGNPGLFYSHAKTVGASSECHFFSGTRFCEMVRSFRTGSATEQDGCLKRFIHGINSACASKATTGDEYMPNLYNDYFRQIAHEFLFSILHLDEHTRRRMTGETFPVIFESKSDNRYEGCTFLRGEGAGRYLFYSFRDMPQEEFDALAARFLRGFFSILGEHDIVAYDQLLPRDYLETVNELLKDTPIKQICVYRDPRDQFVSGLRKDMFVMPRTLNAFEYFYRHSGLTFMLENPNPHRLMLRFEDLILRSEEMKAKILDFLGMDAGNHVRPGSVFVPEISVNNIGCYKYYCDQSFISQLEERLSPYCYFPEKENLSDEAWALLESTGNWKKPTAP